MSNFIWDDPALPPTKSGAAGRNPNTELSAAEVNAFVQDLEDLRVAHANGELRPNPRGTTSVSPAAAVRMRVFNGRAQISENGGAFRDSLSHTVFNVKDFPGADPTGATPSTAAFAAGLAAASAVTGYGRATGLLYVPAGLWTVGSWGMTRAPGVMIVGEGRWATIIQWDTTTSAAAWIAGHTYSVGNQVASNGNVYQAAVGGTAAAAVTPWAPDVSFSLNQKCLSNGNVYNCSTAGAGSTTAVPTPPNGLGAGIVDNAARWDYVSPAPGPRGTNAGIVDGVGALRWNYVGPSPSFFKYTNCQQVHLENLSLVGSATNPPGIMIESHRDTGGGYANTALTMNNVYLGDGASKAFFRGLSFTYTGTQANNADSILHNVRADGYIDCFISLEGSQSRAHAFYDCSAGDGNYVVRTNQGTFQAGQGGDFRWYNGGFYSIYRSCFDIGNPSTGIRIKGVLAEDVHRFFQMYDQDNTADASNTGTFGHFPIHIEDCVFGTVTPAMVPADGRAVCLVGAGPYHIHDNDFGEGVYPIHISVVPTGMLQGTVNDNEFSGPNSVTIDPVEYITAGTGTNYNPLVLRNNTFVDGSNNVVRRSDNDVAGDTNWTLAWAGKHSERLALAIRYTKLNGNNTTSLTIALPALKPHTQLRELHPHLVNDFTGGGHTGITVQFGLTSGDNDLGMPVRIDAAGTGGVGSPHVFGNVDAEVGRALAFKVQGGTPAAPDYPSFSTPPVIYATFKGLNFSTHTLTTGVLNVFVDIEKWPGYPY